jgi:hypothetical protein
MVVGVETAMTEVDIIVCKVVKNQTESINQIASNNSLHTLITYSGGGEGSEIRQSAR